MFLPAGIPSSLTAVFNNPNPLFVAMSVYDDTGASPVLLLSPFAMTQVRSNVYRAKFTPASGKLYIAFMAVYTDATFATLDSAFSAVEQAVSVTAQNIFPTPQSVVGYVNGAPL